MVVLFTFPGCVFGILHLYADFLSQIFQVLHSFTYTGAGRLVAFVEFIEVALKGQY